MSFELSGAKPEIAAKPAVPAPRFTPQTQKPPGGVATAAVKLPEKNVPTATL